MRRSLQYALAGLWLMDGALQLQPAMFTRSFAAHTLAAAAAGNPPVIADSVQAAAAIAAAHPATMNALFALIQLGIGAALLHRRTLRLALTGSVVWGVFVWWFGEGGGALFGSDASALTGAPGAALLYSVLAILIWPPRIPPAQPRSVAAARLGIPAATILWIVLWAGLAALNLEPGNHAPNSIHTLTQPIAAGQPGSIRALVGSFAAITAHHGAAVAIIGSVILILIAISPLLPAPLTRGGIILTLATAAFICVFGEACGALTGGTATDPNSAPLLALIALTYWPPPTTASRPAPDPTAPTPTNTEPAAAAGPACSMRATPIPSPTRGAREEPGSPAPDTPARV